MTQPSSIVHNLSELLGIAIDFGKLALARQLESNLQDDPAGGVLADRIRSTAMGGSYRLVATFDETYVRQLLVDISTMREQSFTALDLAIRTSSTFVETVSTVSETQPRERRERIYIDCARIAAEQRITYEHIMLFSVRTAQILSKFEELRAAVRFYHECEPDPFLPPSFVVGNGVVTPQRQQQATSFTAPPPAGTSDSQPRAGTSEVRAAGDGGDMPEHADEPPAEEHGTPHGRGGADGDEGSHRGRRARKS